jgi:hypothetical protein
MFGQNVGKAMTKEDHLQLLQAHRYLVPLKQFREIQQLAPPIKEDPIPDSQLDTSIAELRRKQREQEEKMGETLINHTLQDAVKAKIKSKRK